MASSGIPALDQLLVDGYPERSSVLVIGPPGIGKEALGYWFTHAGLSQGDFCLYITRLPTREILRDAKAFGVTFDQKVPLWMSNDTSGQIKIDINDLAGISFGIKEVIKKNEGRRMRLVTNILSTLLMLNPPEVAYRFASGLIDEVKLHDAVLLATLEDGMHPPQVITAMQQLFDGVVEFRVYEEGLRFLPIFRIKKMVGVTPQLGYYNFSFSSHGMELASHGK